MTRIALIAALTIAFATPSSAAPKRVEAEAEALIQEGLKLRRVGRDDAALTKFDRAYGLHASPRAAAQKGLCLQALGRWTEAEELLAEALEGGEDAWVTRNRPAIKESLEQAKTKIGRFEITGSPAGAQVFVDGRNVGQLPLPSMVRINAGPAALELTASGFVSERTSLQVEGGSFRRLEFRLKPEQPQTPVATAALPGPETDAEVATTFAGSDPEDRSRPFYKRGWFWGAVGAVVVGGIVAGVLLSTGGEAQGPAVNDRVDL